MAECVRVFGRGREKARSVMIQLVVIKSGYLACSATAEYPVPKTVALSSRPRTTG